MSQGTDSQSFSLTQLQAEREYLMTEALKDIRPAAVHLLRDLVQVKLASVKEQTEGGLYIPSGSQEQSTDGEVFAVGRDVRCVKPGDRVVFSKGALTSTAGAQVHLEDGAHLLMREEEILSVKDRNGRQQPMPDRIFIARLPLPEKVGNIVIPEAANSYGKHGNFVTGIALMVGENAAVQTAIKLGDRLLLHPHLMPTDLRRYAAEQWAEWRQQYDLPEKADLISLYAGSKLGQTVRIGRGGVKKRGMTTLGEVYGVIQG